MSKTGAKTPSLLLEAAAAGGGWYAYRLETGAFPLSSDARAELFSMVDALTHAIAAQLSLRPTLWIDTQPLHHGGQAKLYSTHARAWSPEMGFCFDPAGPPPRPLLLSDLMDVDYGTPPKIHDRSAIRVSAHPQTMSAYRLLAGGGVATLLYFAAENDAQLAQGSASFCHHSREAFRPMMSPGHFQTFPFYLPLLTSQTIAGAGEAISQWLGNGELYLRECFDTQEVVLLSRNDLDPVLRAAGLHPVASGSGNSSWALQHSADLDGHNV
ncbi:MAG TPA: hypothetical protein VKX25_08750 [Bryobacteraceae bacterium]|jgi:hypothetical protein|nr:hypothetical protein [Bryobacteraceae bacterium]